MYFLLSKTLSYLTMPLVIVVALLVISQMVRKTKWRKRILYTGLFLLYFWSNDFIANEVIRWWEIPATPFSRIQKSYEWGIVLTGVTKAEMEVQDRIYFSRGADRVYHAVQLYKMGYVKKILVSGGSGRLLDIGQREANELATAMELMGVAREDILIEAESRNTHESSVEVKKLLERKTKPENCLLITSGFHMRRSAGCFRKAGWPVDTFSADILGHQRTFSFDVLFIPRIEALHVWQHIIKESVGYMTYVMAGYI